MEVVITGLFIMLLFGATCLLAAISAHAVTGRMEDILPAYSALSETDPPPSYVFESDS